MIEIKISKYRKDFPVLKKGDLIYFDNACMTLRPRQVWEPMEKYYKEFPACSGRSTHKLADKASEAMKKAREKVRKFLGAKKSKEIIFTRNTTEGINLVSHSLELEKGDEVLTSDREHNSNLLPWQNLKEKGVKHKIFRSKENEEFSIENFREKLNENTKLVSIVHTSNLDGYTLPVEKIIELAHENGSLVLVDGAQSAPHKQIDVSKFDVDFFAMSAHKMCGPSGMGCLYIKDEHLENIKPFMVGGETVDNSWYDKRKFTEPPEKFEAGLQNVAGAIGFGKACEYIKEVGKERIEKQELKLNQIITEETRNIEKLEIVGVKDWRKRSGIFNFIIKDKDPHEIGMLLNETSNIAVRSGMHCLHSWFNDRNINGSVRASLYFYNTEEEAKKFVEELKEIVKYLI